MKYVREFALPSAEHIYCSAKQGWLYRASFQWQEKGQTWFLKAFSVVSGQGHELLVSLAAASSRELEVGLKRINASHSRSGRKRTKDGPFVLRILHHALVFSHSSWSSEKAPRELCFSLHKPSKNIKTPRHHFQDPFQLPHFQRKTIMEK